MTPSPDRVERDKKRILAWAEGLAISDTDKRIAAGLAKQTLDDLRDKVLALLDAEMVENAEMVLTTALAIALKANTLATAAFKEGEI